MDPLSISASITALGNVAFALTKYIRSVRNAPKKIIALCKEVKNLNIFIANLDRIQHDQELLQDWNAQIETILSPLKHKVDDLNALMAQFEKAQAVDRLKWQFTRSKLQALQSDLRDIRLNIVTFLAVQSS
jgi:hypothetical protein